MFLVTLIPILAIIWTIQVLGRINLVTDTGQSMGSFALLATYILPTIVPVVLPFALVIGITQTLTAMNTDSELPVIDATGAPRGILMRPILLFAAFLSIFSFTVTNFVEPPVRVAARQMVSAAYADLLSSVIEEKTFRSIQDNLYVQIDQRLAGRLLKGLFVADNRDPNFDLVYYAKEGAVDESGTSLTMRDGEVHRKSLDGKVSVIKFDSYAFDLSDMTKSNDQSGPSTYSGDRSLGDLYNPDPTEPSFEKLSGNYRVELHRRLSDWTLPFLFTLISLVIAGNSRSHREARLHPMVSALIIAFGIRWLSFYVANSTKLHPELTPLVYIMPLAIGGVAVWMLSRNKTLRLPSPISRRLSGMIREITSRLRRRASTGGAA
jgi:lipopolysaccharide export system permease protein